MRHSDPSLTANVYTDPKLLDVAGALEALPILSGSVAEDMCVVDGAMPQRRRCSMNSVDL